MRDDIIERCALALYNDSRFGEADAILDPATRAIYSRQTRAVLAAFKEATEEPSATMLAAALPMNDQPTSRDKEIAAEAVTLLDTPTEWLVRSVQLGAQTSLDWRTMQAQLWQEIGI